MLPEKFIRWNQEITMKTRTSLVSCPITHYSNAGNAPAALCLAGPLRLQYTVTWANIWGILENIMPYALACGELNGIFLTYTRVFIVRLRQAILQNVTFYHNGTNQELVMDSWTKSQSVKVLFTYRIRKFVRVENKVVLRCWILFKLRYLSIIINELISF